MSGIEQKLEKVEAEIKYCDKCRLSHGRTNSVAGEGDIHAAVMFIGEAPGKNEDIHGRPFVGAAGKLFDGFLKHAGLARNHIFITNVVKCRPPKNRKPKHDEISMCRNYLVNQIELIDPKIICTLGAVALNCFLENNEQTASATPHALAVGLASHIEPLSPTSPGKVYKPQDQYVNARLHTDCVELVKNAGGDGTTMCGVTAHASSVGEAGSPHRLRVGGSHISDSHGIAFKVNGKIIFPVYHPAASIYNRKLKATIIKDMKKLHNALKSVEKKEK